MGVGWGIVFWEPDQFFENASYRKFKTKMLHLTLFQTYNIFDLCFICSGSYSRAQELVRICNRFSIFIFEVTECMMVTISLIGRVMLIVFLIFHHQSDNDTIINAISLPEQLCLDKKRNSSWLWRKCIYIALGVCSKTGECPIYLSKSFVFNVLPFILTTKKYNPAV